jgi:hypothetical protein
MKQHALGIILFAQITVIRFRIIYRTVTVLRYKYSVLKLQKFDFVQFIQQRSNMPQG